ncbi:MAG: hypothetical protein ACE5I7_19970 [Candidatus Binatia bacterium]
MQRKRVGKIGMILAGAAILACPGRVNAEGLRERIDRMEQELKQMKHELQRQKEVQEKTVASQEAKEGAAPKRATGQYRELFDRVKVGGYGSFRFEHSDLDELKNTFTFRRFVLTTDANIAPRLRAAIELEFERFRKIELEKGLRATGRGLRAQQAVEGTNDSEISLEQGWVQYDLQDWLRFRGGAILVPLGRFNIKHDDNRWDLPRRSLVDRGVPVLPSTAAWDELGVGFNGDVAFGESVLGSYELYVMNGVTLDSTIEKVAETRMGDTTKMTSEVELSPFTGTFNLDNKDAKAVSGRFALSPSVGSEIATSFYWGRYTPDFLPNEDIYAISADGLIPLGPFELEGEYVFTHFGGVRGLARRFANVALEGESEIEGGGVEQEVEFELAKLASDKQGYWIDLRYHFWPALLDDTVFDRPFEHPQLIATVRGEQAWLGGLVRRAEFSAGQLTDFEVENRRVDRVTLGLAYRPVPLVVFQLAYEYTRTDGGRSLGDVTNFLPAQADENDAHAFLGGIAFGF